MGLNSGNPMKYVIVDTEQGEIPLFGVAPLTHEELLDMLKSKFGKDVKLLSAGFVTMTNDHKLKPHGYSHSLNCGPSSSDEITLNIYVNLNKTG